MTTLMQDIRQALRGMRRTPSFAAVAVLTIALGIGANTSIFSVVNAVLLQPAAYPAENPEDVLLLNENHKKYPDGFGVAWLNYLDWLDQNQSFSTMACYQYTGHSLTGMGEPVPIGGVRATRSYFKLMGIEPRVGRVFSEEEDSAGGGGVVLLNHSLWTNRFASDPAVVGRAVTLDDKPYTIIGVLPPDIELRVRERFYTPYVPWAVENNEHRGDHKGASVLARLKPGVTFAQADSEMQAIAVRLEQEYPNTNSGNRVLAKQLTEARVEDHRVTLLLLLGAVILVLLIACANVANLLIARSVARQREIAIQASLGAGRWRIARQTLTESSLLSFIGAAAGLGLALMSLELLRGILPDNLPRLHEVQLSLPVLGYTLGLTMLTGLVFGIAPALQTSRIRLSEVLKQAGAAAGSLTGRRRLSRTFLVAQTALATVLLIGAGLLIRTIGQLTEVDPGFRPDHLVKMVVSLPGDPSREEQVRFYRQARERIEGLPGVEAVAVSLSGPMMGSNWGSIFILADKPVPPRAELPTSIFNPVEFGYFKTFGIPLKKGRVFTEADTDDSQDVIVINETLANRIWPGEDPIGKQLKQGWPESVGESNPWRVVVGVAGDTKQYGLDIVPRMQVFMPMAQQPLDYARITIRTAVEPASIVESAKKAIHQINPNLPIADVETMDEIYADSLAPRRLAMTLLMLFAGIALLLAAIGTYGVIAYSVARRTQEIGVRVAIGAQRRDVLSLVLTQGVKLALLGAGIGLVAAFGATRLLAHLLFGVEAHDPLTFAVVPLCLTVVALIACVIPALRALRIHPSSALRYE
jgi:putative ABC transport system permease protein